MAETLEIDMETVTTRSFVVGYARTARKKSLVLDFTKVEIISRAAADQLITEVEENDTRVILSDEVQKMVDAIHEGEFLHNLSEADN